MKKVLSVFLSIIMLLSITAGIDLSAFAETNEEYDCENGIHCYDFGMNCVLCDHSRVIPMDYIYAIDTEGAYTDIEKEGDFCYFSFTAGVTGNHVFCLIGSKLCFEDFVGSEKEYFDFLESEAEYLDVVGYIYDEKMNEIASSKFFKDCVVHEDLAQRLGKICDTSFIIAKLTAGKTYTFKCCLNSPNETGNIVAFATELCHSENHFYDYGDEDVSYYNSCSANIKISCIICGTEITGDYKHFNTYKDEEAVAATCTTDGRTDGAYCTVCNEVIWGMETIPAKGHIYDDGEVTKEATCTAAGVKTHTCTVCGETETETIPAAGHSYDAGKVTKAATCTTAGVKTYTCTKCKATKTEAISATGHKAVTDKALAATCTTAGKTAGSHCSVCNAVITAQKTVPATGHSYDTGKVTKSATCTTAGVKTYTCTKCKATKTEAISATGHKAVTDKAVAATCTKSGKTAGSHCSVCNAVITAQKTVPATGHSYDAGKVTKAATCTTAGVKTYTCTKCKATKTETIPATGHKAVTDKAVAATCTKAGKTAGSHCSVCNTVITAQKTIAATGHSYDAGKVTKAATATTTGVKTYTCTKCKATKTETIPATGLKAPTLKTTVNANGSFTLSWNKVSDAEKYEIYLKNADGSFSLMKTTTGTSFTTGTAAYGKQYSYKIKAVKGNTKSAYSNTVSATNNKKLQAPTLKVTVNANGSFKLSWNKVAGATKYGIYMKQANGSYKWIKTVTGTSWTTATAQYGKQYTYKVLAANDNKAAQTFSNVVNAKNTKKLTTPSLKVAVNKNGSFKLSWGKVEGATSYQIYMKQANGSYKLIKTTTSTSFTTAVAAKGKTYSYKVRAVTNKNSSATSNYSNVVNAKRK